MGRENTTILPRRVKVSTSLRLPSCSTQVKSRSATNIAFALDQTICTSRTCKDLGLHRTPYLLPLTTRNAFCHIEVHTQLSSPLDLHVFGIACDTTQKASITQSSPPYPYPGRSTTLSLATIHLQSIGRQCSCHITGRKAEQEKTQGTMQRS